LTAVHQDPAGPVTAGEAVALAAVPFAYLVRRFIATPERIA
jgi:hypothetical protein